MTLTIRTIQKEDKQGIKELVEILNKVDNLDYSLTDEWLDYVIEVASEGIFVAIYRYKLVGLATCMINQMDKSQATVNVVIHPDYRRLGIGSKLYNQVISYSKGRNIMVLETYIKKRLNSSVNFAKKRGFHPVLYLWQMELEVDKVKPYSIGQNSAAFTYREATIKDNNVYAGIINQTFGDALDDSALGQLLKDNSIKVYMLEEKGKVIGSTTIQFRTNLSIGYIYDVAIVEECRSRGLGSHMLKNCINELKNNNMDKASLLVTGENRSALALYHRLGFKEVDIDIIMQKKN